MALGEETSATKWSVSSCVPDSNKADVVKAGDVSLAHHALGNLDFDLEVGVSCRRETNKPISGYVLDDLSTPESFGV